MLLDVLGGYLLPKRFGRKHPSPARFAATLLRGSAAHTLMLALIGLCLLFAARGYGVPGAAVAGILASVALLAVRDPLSRCIAPLRKVLGRCDPLDVRGRGLRVTCIASEDQGFTGGINGVFRARSVIVPELWTTVLGAAGFQVALRRRQLAVLTGSWFRGRVLALGFTWVGIVVAAVLVSSDRIGSAAGVIFLDWPGLAAV